MSEKRLYGEPGYPDPAGEQPGEGAAAPRSNDPLAELARLIDEDPFADFNRQREGGNVAAAPKLAVTDAPVELDEAAAEPAPEEPAANLAQEVPRKFASPAEEPYAPPAEEPAYDPLLEQPAFDVEPEPEPAPAELPPIAAEPEPAYAPSEAYQPDPEYAPEPDLAPPSEYAAAPELPVEPEPVPEFAEPDPYQSEPVTEYQPAPAEYQEPVATEESWAAATDDEAAPDLSFEAEAPAEFAVETEVLPAESGWTQAVETTESHGIMADPVEEPVATSAEAGFDPASALEAELRTAFQESQRPPDAVEQPAHEPAPAADPMLAELEALVQPEQQPAVEPAVPPAAVSQEAPVSAEVLAESDPVFQETGHVPPYLAEPEEGGRKRGFMLVAILAGLMVAGGAVAYAYKEFGFFGESSPPPVIKASNKPVKVLPADPGGEEIPHQNKLVYDRVDGQAPDREERVVPREEEVMDVASQTNNRQVRVIDPGLSGNLRPGTDATEVTDAEGNPVVETTTGPRRVRTMIVKPDGTVVSSGALAEETPQPAREEELPVTTEEPRETVAVITDSGVPLPPSRPTRVATVQPAAPAPAQPATPITTSPGESFVPPAAPAENPTPQPTRTGPIQLQPGPAATPQAAAPQPAPAPVQTAPAQQPRRTTGRADDVLSLDSQPVRTQSVQPAQPAPQPTPQAAPAPAGSYVVQVASRRDEGQARDAASSIASRYGNVLGSYQPAVQRADLGSRGVFYRVGVGPVGSQQEANALCGRLKSAGLDCFVRRN